MRNKTQGGKPKPRTELSLFLRRARDSKGVTAKDMAAGLGIASGQLSEKENGKKGMNIEFLIQCMNYFEWGIKEGDSIETRKDKVMKTVELFSKGFLSTNESISLNMKYFHGTRKKLLAMIITSLLLLPERISIGTILTKKEILPNYKETMVEANEIFSSCCDRILVEYLLRYQEINDLDRPQADKEKEAEPTLG